MHKELFPFIEAMNFKEEHVKERMLQAVVNVVIDTVSEQLECPKYKVKELIKEEKKARQLIQQFAVDRFKVKKEREWNEY